MKGPSDPPLQTVRVRETDQNMNVKEPTDFLLNNRDFFKGYRFNFEGLDADVEEGYIEVVKDLGAQVCKDPDFILIDEPYFKMVEGPRKQKLYHIAYIYDSLKAEKPLNISKYSLFNYAFNVFSKSNRKVSNEGGNSVNKAPHKPSASTNEPMIKTECNDYDGEYQNGIETNFDRRDAEFFDEMNEIHERMRANGKLEHSVEEKSDHANGDDPASDVENDTYSIDSETFDEKNEILSNGNIPENRNKHLRVKSIDSINDEHTRNRTNFQEKILEESLSDSSNHLAEIATTDKISNPKPNKKAETEKSKTSEEKNDRSKTRKRIDSTSSEDSQAKSVDKTQVRKKKLKTVTSAWKGQTCSSKSAQIILSSDDQESAQDDVEVNRNMKKNPHHNAKSSGNHPCSSHQKKAVISGNDSDESNNELSMSSDTDEDEKEATEVNKKPFNRFSTSGDTISKNPWWEVVKSTNNPCHNPSCTFEPQPHQFHSDPDCVKPRVEKQLGTRYCCCYFFSCRCRHDIEVRRCPRIRPSFHFSLASVSTESHALLAAYRLDRLFILLDTGTNAVTKNAAAQQLGEAQRLHPHELHHLLARVSTLLKSSQWDTRIAAAQAVQAIISQVPVWDPEPIKKESGNGDSATSIHKWNNKLCLENFDMTKLLAQSSYLTGSEGTEYDLTIVEGEQTPAQDEKLLASKLGLDPKLMGVNASDLFSADDLTPVSLPDCKSETEKMSIEEALQQSIGLSRREMNRARRKARQSISKQRSRDPDDGQDSGNCSSSTQNSEQSCKKAKLEDSGSIGAWYNVATGTVTDPRCAVPDGTGCWPDSAVDWPLEAFAESLLQDLFSMKWEVRHGAATALREFVKVHGRGAGKSRNQTEEEMEESHRRWIIDAALRLLCVLGIDRFGDFISDQVVAPVRETCAQALGSLIVLISNKKKARIKSEMNGDAEMPENDKDKAKVNLNNIVDSKDIMDLLQVMLKLLENAEWEARHGALLAIKYLLAVRKDLRDEILPPAFPAIMKGLSDSVEDVGAMAASALIPVAPDLPRLLEPAQLESIVLRLWQLLKEQDDLASACISFMGLLASILSLPAARACLTPQPLSQILPRLWPFLNHSSSSVRKATLQTLETLTSEDGDNDLGPKQRWGEEGGVVLQEALRNVFQRVLIEHIWNIQEVAERVWENLITRSDLELLLHAACPLVSTWLCLAMQPEHVPFNPTLLVNMISHRLKSAVSGQEPQQQQYESTMSNNSSSKSSSSTSSELKAYIGGIETVTQNTRRGNVVRARCMAARMLGRLSGYVVKPAPNVVYTPEIPSPSLCYAKVLLAHLNSRSALQRMMAALTMAHWATLENDKPPEIPDILEKQLFVCLNEYIYYDEIAAQVTRLLHESRDYVATLKHYKLPLSIEVNTTGVMTLEQIAQLAASPVPSPCEATGTSSKLKPKILESLEERRRGMENSASSSAAQLQTLHVTTTAALAGAATMLRCLPEPPRPLNPLIKPLMEAIKREENEELQKLAAKHLAHLVNLCVNRTPCPNAKIATNLCTFLCSDPEFTPRTVITDFDYEPFNGILTLNNRQKQAERSTYYGRGSTSGVSGGRGPGRPPATDIPLEELLANDEPEAKAAKTRRLGATAALTTITELMGAQLPDKLPQLWDLLLPAILKDYKMTNKIMTYEESNQMVFSLQVLEVVVPSIHQSLLPSVMECLDQLCQLLANSFKTVRHMASRCIAVIASLNIKETMNIVVQKIITLLETNNVESTQKNSALTPAEVDSRRQGAAEALACLVDSLGVSIVPYAVLFMVPLLGRMSDQNQCVRLACSATFATLVQLLPLDPGAIDSSNLVQEKAQERRFLEQLLNPRSIPDTELTVPVAAELRTYQQQGLNWLNFLNRYQLHGVLCDDMGLGKTLQTLCIIALDHNRNKQAPSSLVVCPPTLTGHWVYEAKKFFQTKDLSVVQYAGNPTERERLHHRVTRSKLVVASYDIVRKDIEFFEAIQWNYCVLDEGHIIKNGKTKSAKAAKRLHAHHRLILSGTPVQNDVLELWSLFDFLMPGFLGTEKQFAAKYSRPILSCREPKAGAKEQEAGALAMESLHRQVLPFLLRRNKEDVLQDLPPKITQDYYCDLSPLQKSLYEDFKSKHSATLVNQETSSSNSRSGHVFEALRYLRNVCNHPKLVLSMKHPQYLSVLNMLKQQHSTLEEIEHSAKLPALKQLLLDCGIGQPQSQQQPGSLRNNVIDSQQSSQLVSQHRALIFCQMKAMLDIVENDLLRVHLPTVTYLRLDGSVPSTQRHSVVARFNADPSIDVLLLTTQVGGLGLNLTGADTVIFVEHDWNPMKDLQAMDRAHRIGQKKVVNVYRLITRQTLEEKIMGLQKFKIMTANTIISTENTSLETMRTEQLLDLFSLDSNDNKKTRKDGGSDGGSDMAKISGVPGINRAILESLPEFWEQQQYDDEYNMDSFLEALKNSAP
ncbi:hypothetical protein QAD02_019476 [Eretmocerus hayati]|uniref:Uncharacterized protein n=1 Tax=Eretmocerus hayati TaxID=131215 RepID=A0ACC2PK60_9HYME|nr:hypothetical protein QAD02_019476 [Eretmocerus hayati]